MPVRERDLERGIAGDHPESVIGKMEIADNLGSEHARDVRSGRSAAAGGDLFRDTASADDVAAFENEGGVSGAGEVGSSSKAVVSSADNDGVVNRVWTAGHAADQWSN
jgi:hypothetical protein